MLLEVRQLTPTQFADAIGIARPIVSHILSGRNKPSLEVVQRILAAMPDLSMPWLLNGTGPMEAPTPAASAPGEPASQPVSQGIDNDLINKQVPLLAAKGRLRSVAAQEPQRSTASPPAAPLATNRPRPKRFAAKPLAVEPVAEAVLSGSMPLPFVAAAVPPQAPGNEPVPVAALPAVTAPVASADATPTAAALLAGTEKPIRRIVIFYRDGSFADYQPE